MRAGAGRSESGPRDRGRRDQGPGRAGDAAERTTEGSSAVSGPGSRIPGPSSTEPAAPPELRSTFDLRPSTLLTPARRRGVEILDDGDVPPAVRLRSLDDVRRSNRLLGGLRAMMGEVERTLPELGPDANLLDVGTGLGDVPAAAQGIAARAGVRLSTVGVDLAPELAAAARHRVSHAVCGDAFRLPFADGAFDVVTCSQLLHHFPDHEGLILLRELDRVALRRVIVGDLRRSWLAAGGFWLVSFPLAFHPVTRHDGTLSVLRGFTAGELGRMVRDAVGRDARVRRWTGWRLTASWPATAMGAA